MAELDAACCPPEAQETCCEPEAKSECCGGEGGCGCADGHQTEDVRESVRERYAGAARAAAERDNGALVQSDCSHTHVALADKQGTRVFGDALYAGAETDGVNEAALSASLGCGVPTAVAELREGETVLDLGSGAGADLLISARRVGPAGRAIGLDMTDEMLELARQNAAEAGIENVEFRKGYIEEIPLEDESVDVVISNCVINLSGDKPAVLREVARILRPGGRFAVSDVIADRDMDAPTRADMRKWTGCIAGALTAEQYERYLGEAGLTAIDIKETHRVHEHASAAVIRARRPAAA